jgi:hypothetical protein
LFQLIFDFIVLFIPTGAISLFIPNLNFLLLFALFLFAALVPFLEFLYQTQENWRGLGFIDLDPYNFDEHVFDFNCFSFCCKFFYVDFLIKLVVSNSQ